MTNQIQNEDPSDRLLRFHEALSLVGISRSQAYKLLEANDFPTPVKIGRNNYFSKHEIEMWIEDRLHARPGRSAS